MSEVGRNHVGDKGAGEVEQSLHIRVDHLLPVLDVTFVHEVEAARLSGVVQEHVRGPIRFGQFHSQCINRSPVAHIQLGCPNRGPMRCDQFRAEFCKSLGSASDQDQPSP